MVRRDPLSLVVSFMFQGRLDAGGRHGEALAEYERSKDLTGDRGMLEFLAFLRLWAHGKPDEVKSQYQIFLKSRGPEMRDVLFDRLEPVLFDHEAAHSILAGAGADSANENAARLVHIALLAGAFGATDIALVSARRAFIDMNFRPQRFLWLPVLAQARKDPRFKQILRDLGLYEYWRTTGKWGEFARPVGKDDFEIFR